MRKNLLPIVGAVCISLGFCMATGVDCNPLQAVYALVMMVAGYVCFNVHKRMKKSAKKQNGKTIGGAIRDAA